nr:MAG TPA: hypothetical protein [Caudoviricetes sp.]
MKYCVCEVEGFDIEYANGDYHHGYKVARVLQVFNSKEEAEDAELLFNPADYGDHSTIVRVVAADMLLKEID